VPSLGVKLLSPEYFARALSGKPDAVSADVTLHVATPPDISIVFERPSHWTGPEEPSSAKVTVPVGVAALSSAPVTFARNVRLEPASATTNSVVVELA
jgi:hypothetical protein